jgi:glyoxylase-like metal-dependent hydrolase (beta-lactamase superfamily II)
MKAGRISIAVQGAIALAAGFAMISVAEAQGGFGPPELTLVPVEGHDNLHLIRDQFNGNITVIVGEEGVVLVDTKSAQVHDGVVGFIRSITDAPIKYVIDTHLHPDHTGGNPPLLALGATLIASENARRIMAERASAGLPNITLRDTARIWLDAMPIDLYYFGRGHTDGDIIVHLPTEDVIIMGDLFALWGNYESVIDYSAGGSLRDWPRTLDRALELDFDLVIPGHSGVTDRAMIVGYQDYLVRIQQMVREMTGQGRPREDIQMMLQTEFNWGGLSMGTGLDGVILEMGAQGGGRGRPGGAGGRPGGAGGRPGGAGGAAAPGAPGAGSPGGA